MKKKDSYRSKEAAILPGAFKQPSDLPKAVDVDVVSDAKAIDSAQGEQFLLQQRLLSFAGSVVCFDSEQHLFFDILNAGVFLYGEDAMLVPGVASNCHESSAIIWRGGQDDLVLMTGYALGFDGKWYRHSWCAFEETGKVIETTQNMAAYFGFVLDDLESDDFYDLNYIPE